MKGRFVQTVKWIAIIVVVIVIAGWLFIEYTNRDFLRYGLLHVDKLPPSVQLLDYHTYGASDFHAEYYISINPKEMSQLLQGRKYTKDKASQSSLLALCAGPQRDAFPAIDCYSSGDLDNGLVNIFTNADHTMALLVYDVR